MAPATVHRRRAGIRPAAAAAGRDGRRRLGTAGLALAACAAACASHGERLADGSPLRRVNAPVAFSMLRDTPDLLIVDVRTPEEYSGPYGHLANAVNVPLAEVATALPRYEPFRNSTFLVYCRDGDDCGRQAIEILEAAGFANAILMDGGIEGWLGAGFGTVGRHPAPASPPDTGEEDPPVPPAPFPIGTLARPPSASRPRRAAPGTSPAGTS